MTGIGTPYVPVPEIDAGTVALSGAHTDSVNIITVGVALTAIPQSGLIIVNDEIIAITGFNNSTGHHYTGATRGAYGTVARAHSDGISVYEVMAVIKQSGGVMVYFFNADESPNLLETRFIPKFVASATLEVASTAALPANLTDSTTGVVSVTTPPTLIVMRTDTTAHLMADAAANLATLNAHVNLLAAYIAGLEVTSES